MDAQLLHSYVSVSTDEPLVAFTFDDGPHPTRTPVVLDSLAAHDARATFFLLGVRAREHPELCRRIVSEGHEVAVHGEEHLPLHELSLVPQLRFLGRARRSVRSASGARPEWFRAPYGKQSKRTVIAGRLLGLHPVMWSSFAEEWTDQPLDACVALAEPGLRAGGVVLLHDGVGDGSKPPGRDEAGLGAVVTALLEVADSRGLRVVPFGELAASGQPVRRPWFGEWNL